METRTYTVKKYDELTEEEKEKVLENYRDINVDYEWWDCIYDDAKNIGLELTGFDLYRQTIEGDLSDDVLTVIQNIKRYHGKKTETYKRAIRYAKEARRQARLKNPDKTGEENLKHEFTQDLLEDYRIALQNEYEYLMSQEAVEETLQANDYDFDTTTLKID